MHGLHIVHVKLIYLPGHSLWILDTLNYGFLSPHCERSAIKIRYHGYKRRKALQSAALDVGHRVSL